MEREKGDRAGGPEPREVGPRDDSFQGFASKIPRKIKPMEVEGFERRRAPRAGSRPTTRPLDGGYWQNHRTSEREEAEEPGSIHRPSNSGQRRRRRWPTPSDRRRRSLMGPRVWKGRDRRGGRLRGKKG